ncbi:MAG TPA: hypothetical protein VNN62_12720 [Methylomirabilota bacterium]|nr:hypothetical protein [Methylomirabilota bacterium]
MAVCCSILRRLIVILTVMWFWGLTAIGQADESPKRWTPIGPEKADVQSFAIDPTNPQILYAGTFSGGVFKSTNGGDRWDPINTGLDNHYSVTTLIVDPGNSQIIYAATNVIGNTRVGPIFKSENGGASWSRASDGSPSDGLPKDKDGNPLSLITALALDPKNSQILYAGVAIRSDNNLRLGTVDAGRIFKSTDGGAHWVQMSDGIPSDRADIQTLLIDPIDSQIVYAGTTDGVYKSVNGGASWTPTSTGLSDPLVSSLAIARQNSSILYAATLTGVFKTTNGGASWASVSTGLPDFPGINTLTIDPRDSLVAYAGAFGKVFKTTNGGASWVSMDTGLPNTFVQTLTLDPQNPLILYAGTFGGSVTDLSSGVFKTTDGGASWTVKNTGLNNFVVTALVIDPTDPRTLYGSGDITLIKTTTGGSTWTTISDDLPPFALTVAWAIDPKDPQTLYIGGKVTNQNLSQVSSGVFKSTNGGSTWLSMNTGLPDNADVSGLAIDPTNTQLLYASLRNGTVDAGNLTGLVFKSTNGGNNWVDISQGLSLDFEDNNKDFQVARFVIAPTNPQTLYVTILRKNDVNRSIWKSLDGGAHWTNISFAESKLSRSGSEGALTVDPTNAQILYVGTPGLFKSLDGGATWTDVHIPVPPGAPPGSFSPDVQSLVIDPTNPQILYAGVRPGGVYKSIDGGAHWTALNAGFPGSFADADDSSPNFISIDALVLAPTVPRLIYAGTQGNSVFRIEQ